MNHPIAFQPADFRGISQLIADAIAGIAYIVESLHHNFSVSANIVDTARLANKAGAGGIHHQNIRKFTAQVSDRLDTFFTPLPLPIADGRSSPKREALLAALNGVLGDHLRDTANPLAIPMRFRYNGKPLGLSRLELASSIPRPTDRLLVLVHGLCMNDLQWIRQPTEASDSIQRSQNENNESLYSILANDLSYVPVYLHYNSGLHISTNGHEFSDMMESLITHWPVPLHEVVIIANSMGGLVTRSACYYSELSGYHWVKKLRKLFFLGTPHHGSPLERIGNWVDATLSANRFTAPFAALGKIRSAGITDLRYGNLLDEDWHGRDRFERTEDLRKPVPLPYGVQCYVLAATTGRRAGDIGDLLLGDGLVPLRSALGYHHAPHHHLRFPPSRQWIGYGMNHMGLIGQPAVYERIRGWLQP